MKTSRNDPTSLTVPSRVAQKALRAASRVPLLPSRRRYNLTVSEKYKFLWFRVAKVGTRTIFSRLTDDKVKLDLESPYGIHYTPLLYHDYFKFAFVRNPWDRLVSCWQNKVLKKNYFDFPDPQYKTMQSFAGFVEWVEGCEIDSADLHLRSQSALIDLDNCDYLGRMETFEEDLHNVFKFIGLPNNSRNNSNLSSGRKRYQDYYSADLIQRVANIYQKDIQIFGYRFEEPSD